MNLDREHTCCLGVAGEFIHSYVFSQDMNDVYHNGLELTVKGMAEVFDGWADRAIPAIKQKMVDGECMEHDIDARMAIVREYVLTFVRTITGE